MKGTYQVPAHKELYVERDDCSLEDHAEFFGFTVGKLVGLKYFGVVVVKYFIIWFCKICQNRLKW